VNEITALQFDAIDAAKLAHHAELARRPVCAVPTPFPTWNSACRDEGGGEGVALGWHVVVAGATGAGKSIVALNLAAAAVQNGDAVCYLSLEMSQSQLITRLLAVMTGNGVRYLEAGQGHDRSIMQAATTDFTGMLERSGGSIRVNRHPLRRLTDIDLVFGYFTEREPCTVFIVDYLQLAWAGNAKGMLDNITEISHSIRSRAHGHKVVSIGLSQFNRQTSSNRADRPSVEGLMGGSPLENDADQVVLLDHTSYERQGTGRAQGKLLLAKNRHGPQAEIPVEWNYQNLQVREGLAAGEPEAAWGEVLTR
jgi:replicative DNA helicase